MRLWAARVTAAVLAASMTVAGGVRAQEQAPEQNQDQERPPSDAETASDAGDDAPGSTPAEAASAETDPAEELEQAYRNLQSSDEDVWREAEQTIARSWRRSGSASIDVLLGRARQAIEKEDWDRAWRHLTDVVNLMPEFAQGWNLRATVNYRRGALGEAVADLGIALSLDPRHFGALTGLGFVLKDLGDDAGAVRAFRLALTLHPNLETAKTGLQQFPPWLDGVDI